MASHLLNITMVIDGYVIWLFVVCCCSVQSSDYTWCCLVQLRVSTVTSRGKENPSSQTSVAVFADV